jgi:hypothetical protein
VGRPPQELMRGWGRAPICKASRPDHGLGIRATHNLVKEARKEGVVGRGRPAKSAETRGEALGFKEELGNKCSGRREMASRRL